MQQLPCKDKLHIYRTTAPKNSLYIKNIILKVLEIIIKRKHNVINSHLFGAVQKAMSTYCHNTEAAFY